MNMTRIMGLDYGSKTVGVAVSDGLGLTAQGVETITRTDEGKLRRTLARIEELSKEYQVTRIVLGYPKNMDNSAGERVKKTEEVAAMVEKRTGLPVVFWDERLSTVSAERVDVYKRQVTTRIEHPSVYNPLIFLEEQGFEVTYLPVDQDGHISLEELRDSLRGDTILVSVMYVNNEIGAAEPIDEISAIIKEKSPKALFHVDAIQAYGKYQIRPKKQGIDLLSVSGHKIHGPKGAGFLLSLIHIF